MQLGIEIEKYGELWGKKCREGEKVQLVKEESCSSVWIERYGK